MKTIGIRVTIASDGKLLIKSPIEMPVGECNAVLVLEEQPIQNNNQVSLQTSLNNAQLIFGSIFLLKESFQKS